jgi:hypothetical protein
LDLALGGGTGSDDEDDEEYYGKTLFVTTGGNDMVDEAKSSNPFKMGNQLKSHIRQGTKKRVAGSREDSDEEGEELD